MRKSFTLAGILIYAIATASRAFAEDRATTYTDAAATIAALLTAVGKLPVTRYHQETRTGPVVCHPIGPPQFGRQGCHASTYIVSVPVTTQEILTASNISVSTPMTIGFGPMQFKSFPSSPAVSMFQVTNCLATPQQAQATISVAVQRTTSVQVTHSVTDTNGSTLGLSLSLPSASDAEAGAAAAAAFVVDAFDGGGGGGGGGSMGTLSGSITVSQARTEATATTVADSNTITQSQNATVSEPANSKSFVAITAYRIDVTVPFTVTVTVDADISGNDKGYKHISDVISLTDRTFQVNGSIFTNGASVANVVFYAAQPVTAQECAPPVVPVRQIDPHSIVGNKIVIREVRPVSQ